MHVGRTTGALQPLLKLASGQVDGAVSADGRVAGCYIHGLLADDRQRQHWLQRIGGEASAFAYESDVDATLDLLADHLEEALQSVSAEIYRSASEKTQAGSSQPGGEKRPTDDVIDAEVVDDQNKRAA